MILHTDTLDQAKPRVLRHNWLLRAVVMSALIAGEDGEKTRQNMYVSAASITRWRWLKDQAKARQESRFGIIDRRLREGGSAGATIKAVPGLLSRQNRLALWIVPEALIPARIRRMVDRKDARWRIELYALGGLDPKARKFGQYGVFVEFAPASLPLPHRVMLGSQTVWRLMGRNDEFVQRLMKSQSISQKKLWQQVAVAIDRLKAGVLLPILAIVVITSRQHNVP